MSNSTVFFIGLVLFMTAIVSAYVSRGSIKRLYTYLFLTTQGQGALKGIVLFVGIGIVLALLTGCSNARYMTEAELFLGVDNTFSRSPQCHDQTDLLINNNRLTSNGGAKVTLAEVGVSKLNFKYTHHSCAFNEDRESYDAFGFEATTLLYRR